MRCFLDSNIFLYALGAEHPEKAPCRGLLDLTAAGEIHASISSEVLQEVLHFRLRRGSREEALRTIRGISTLVDEVLPVFHADMMKACDLLAAHPTLGARDAVHAAVAMRNGISRIVSADRDFDVITGLKRLSAAQAIA